MLVIAGAAAGCAVLAELMRGGATPPSDARLVLVHALDPAAFAGVTGDAAWPLAMLRAVATEDLSHVRALTVLTLGAPLAGLAQALETPDSSMTFLDAPQQDGAPDRIRAILASL
jgi:hypothetical protein